MIFSTRSELRAAFAEALAKQADPTDPAAAIRAAVDLVMPERMNRGFPFLREEFLALADAIQGGERNA